MNVPIACPHCGETLTRRRSMTATQSAVYRFLRKHHEATGRMPTFLEVAKHFGYRSLSTVHEHMDNLVYRGWLHRWGENVPLGYLFTKPLP